MKMFTPCEYSKRGIPLKTNISLVYSKQFFELQLVFAQKIADVSHQSLDQVVLRFTALYRILGLDWNLDPTNPIWQILAAKLQCSARNNVLVLRTGQSVETC